MNDAMTEGYTLRTNVLTKIEVDGVRDAITETIDRTARALRTPFEQSAPHTPLESRLDEVAKRDHAYATALFHAVMADAQRDPRVATLTLHEALSNLMRELLAPMAVTGQVVRTRAALAAFGSSRSPWHQDVIRPSAVRGSCGSVQLAFWLPLSDVDEQSGALEVIPGSWHAPLPHELAESGHFVIPDRLLPAMPRRTVPVNAGDVLVLDRFIPHRSLPMPKGRGRWAVVMWIKAQ